MKKRDRNFNFSISNYIQLHFKLYWSAFAKIINLALLSSVHVDNVTSGIPPVSL